MAIWAKARFQSLKALETIACILQFKMISKPDNIAVSDIVSGSGWEDD
jgi:hypothetical protein